MTNSEKIKRLKQYRSLDGLVRRRIADCIRLRELARSLSPPDSDLPRGRCSGSRLQEASGRIDDLERQVRQDIMRMTAVRRQIEATISTVGEHILRQVLELKYIDGKTFEEIAEEVHYDVRHVKRLYIKALDVTDCHAIHVI